LCSLNKSVKFEVKQTKIIKIMKKTYILGMALMAGSISFAQANNALVKKEMNAFAKTAPSIRPTAQSQERATILWSDDMSSAATWDLTNNNTGGLALDWSIETNPALIPVAALAPFASATAANGFLFISSDANNTADGDGTIIDVTAENNTTIDLTGEPNVTLRFSQNYRWWQEVRTVRVSGNGGTTYTDFELSIAGNGGFDVTPNFGSGEQNSGNPQLEFLDISLIAGGQSDVKVQFVYNDGDIWGWYWAIDDVDIIVKEDNDLFKGDTYLGSIGGYDFPFVYHQVPVAQIAPIDGSVLVSNIGSLQQTGVQFNVDVNGTTTSSAASTIDPNMTDSLFVASYTPAGLGQYVFNYSITADQVDANGANNSFDNDTVVVNDFIYARDNGTLDGGRSNDGAEYRYGNIFDIVTEADLQAISFVANSNSVANAEVSVILYQYDNTNTTATSLVDLITPIASSDLGNPYVLTQSDIDNETMVNVKFENGPVTLQAGGTYLAVVNAVEDQATTSQFVCGSAGESAAGTSYLYDETDATWYYVTETPMVRLNFDASLGTIDSKELTSSLNAYPNPANTNVNVNFSVNESATVDMSVVSVTGDVVYNNNFGTIAAGKYSKNINVSELANGVYFYTLTVNGNVTTKKLVISKK
jgi:hypothetical protein